MIYSDLKSHFNDLLNRSDITTALTTRFISQGISRIQRSLRTPMSERVLEVTITGKTETMTLPVISWKSSRCIIRQTSCSASR